MLLYGEAAPLTMPQQTILCLVTHFAVAVAANRDIDLLKPFRDFLKDPMSLKGCYIPTMPEENLDAVMKAIHEMQKNNFGENITFYRCPNGHLYSIGDCGRPWVQAVCPHCGEKIGGTSHNLLGDNTKDLGENKTKPGYILGPASDRAKQAVPERKLSAAACELLRFMIHALFLWKTLDSPQAIDQLCSEDIGEDRVFHFFLEHVVKSFEILKHTLGKSPEDICIFLHNMCAQITKTERTQTSGDSTMSLKDLGSRAKWEEQMLQDLLNPALKRQDEYIKEGRKEVLSEYGASSDVLLTVIHEREENADELDINQENLHVHPVVWRYRTRVSLEHFANSFRIHIMEKDGNDKEFHILKSFMEMNEVLQYIRHVPDILKLQKLLMEQYFRKIDKDEAGQRTIQQHLEDCKTDGTKAVYETLIQKTTRVWDDLKRHLTNHLCRTESAFNQFPKEYTTITITNSTTLDMLLPSTRGLGICSYAMLEFLLMKQNEFLEKIYPEEMAKSEKVKVPSLMDIQLISYDPDVDILPTILANSTCSFKYREGTEINYEFMNFQSQIEDSIFSAKSLIDTRSIPVMTFRSEIRDVFVFKSMNQSQESLPQQAKRQISSEMNDLSDIYTSLSNIFIVARFLETLTCDPSMLLDEFMTEKLHFEVSLHSQKARQCCQIKHVKSLWISLSHDRAKRLTENGKNAFDELQKELREEMDKTDEQQIKDFFDKTSTEKLELLLEAIFEVILFRLPEYSEGEDRHVDVKGISLYELLEAHLEDSFFAETNESGKRLEWESVPNFPQTIQAGYAVEIWKLLFRTLSKSHGDN